MKFNHIKARASFECISSIVNYFIRESEMQVAEAAGLKNERGGASGFIVGNEACFHCGEAVPAYLELSINIDGENRPMCCAGCEAVAAAIVDYGLTDYYRFRDQPARRPEELIPEELQRLQAYDSPALFAELVADEADECKSTSLLLADMTCPACVWLIESRLGQQDGVKKIEVNFSSQKAQLSWDPTVVDLSSLLKTITMLGYKVRPYEMSEANKQLDQEQKDRLRRLGVAGVLGMQVMMLSVALYVGEWSGMNENFKNYFSWLCWALSTPVMFYSAKSFFVRAWRDLRLFRTGMDVPVSLGLVIAYLSSSWATVSGGGQIYYDSIVMFVFFLLGGRYFEFRSRRQSAQMMDSVGQIIPSIATRKINRDLAAELETVAVEALEIGDILLIRSGDVVPTDGILLEGTTSMNESLLTGESHAIFKKAGDFLIGGSTNVGQSVYMSVSQTGKDTVCSHIYRLMQQGQQQKPSLLALSNRVSAYFVFFVLMLALGTAIFWLQNDPEIWLSTTIAVLVVTCPCALSLATPLALAAASTALMKRGVILVNANALEALNSVSHFVFDKTGTLTRGELTVFDFDSCSASSRSSCMDIASAIELESLHPIAGAFKAEDENSPGIQASCIKNYPGGGLSGLLDNKRWFIGNEQFIKEQTGLELEARKNSMESRPGLTKVLLADGDQIHCVFYLKDLAREGADEVTRYLEQNRKRVMILSGDGEQATRTMAESIGVTAYAYAQSPSQKMEKIKEMQSKGIIVAMIGDGANDAPVLASADVSIAMGDGAALANTSAEIILLDGRLDKLIRVMETAELTRKIIRQNMSWAILYNLLALPLAMSGIIAPWMAALGMSFSSLLVVLNSRRINRGN